MSGRPGCTRRWTRRGTGSTALRAPHRPLVLAPQRLTEITGPLLGEGRVAEADADLTTHHAGEPLGERIILSRPGAGQ